MKTNFDSESLAKYLEKSEARKQLENTPEIMELRKLRNEASEQAQKYQQQIDEKIKELHKVPDIKGKLIKINLDNQTCYGHVSSVERLFDGVRIYYDYGFDVKNGFSIKQGLELGKMIVIHNSDKSYSNIVYWDKLDTIENINTDDFDKTLSSLVENFIKTKTL